MLTEHTDKIDLDLADKIKEVRVLTVHPGDVIVLTVDPKGITPTQAAAVAERWQAVTGLPNKVVVMAGQIAVCRPDDPLLDPTVTPPTPPGPRR